MKKYVAFTVSAAILLLTAALSIPPKAIEHTATPVYLTSIQKSSYSQDIFASGVVEERAKKDVIVKLPLVPDRVYFGVGDYVKIGDVIADVDVDATTRALFDLTDAANLIPQEYVSAIASLNIDTSTVDSYIPNQITATADGIITSISMVSGAVTPPNSTVATISNQDDLRLKLSVSENDISNVKHGDTIVFKATATGDQKYLGTVDLIFPAATKTIVGTSQATIVNIYVKLKENYTGLKPGYTVSGAIKAPSERTLTTLPYDCILQDADNQEFIYIATGNKVSRCDVNTGMEHSDGVEIISPPLDGQRIVANPNDIHSADDIIKIIEN